MERPIQHGNTTKMLYIQHCQLPISVSNISHSEALYWSCDNVIEKLSKNFNYLRIICNWIFCAVIYVNRKCIFLAPLTPFFIVKFGFFLELENSNLRHFRAYTLGTFFSKQAAERVNDKIGKFFFVNSTIINSIYS